MGLKQFAQENVAIREGLFSDEGIAAVVLERVTEGCSLSCTLGCVEVARGLYNLSELLVCVRKTDVRLLDVECCELGTKIRFGDTEI